MTTETGTRVMLVDDHSIMRDLLRDALENTGEFQVVAQAADGEEAVRVVREAAPDVIVMDVIMPVMDGIEACREIMELLPGTRVLMLTASNEKDAIVRSIAAGATGYLQKYSGKEQLLATLRDVAQGEFRIPGDAARRLARAVRSPSTDAASERLGTLTDREKAILKLFAQGTVLPGDRRDKDQQRLDGAQRRVRRPEEAGVQDPAADGGLGGAGRTGGRWLSVILISPVPKRNSSWGCGKTCYRTIWLGNCGACRCSLSSQGATIQSSPSMPRNWRPGRWRPVHGATTLSPPLGRRA